MKEHAILKRKRKKRRSLWREREEENRDGNDTQQQEMDGDGDGDGDDLERRCEGSEHPLSTGPFQTFFRVSFSFWGG